MKKCENNKTYYLFGPNNLQFEKLENNKHCKINSINEIFFPFRKRISIQIRIYNSFKSINSKIKSKTRKSYYYSFEGFFTFFKSSIKN